MKVRIFISMACVALFATSAKAQKQAAESAPAPVVPSQAVKEGGGKPDPFIKGKAAGGAASVPLPDSARNAVVIPPNGGLRIVLETYSMEMASLDSLLVENLEDETLLQRVRQLVTAKQATLDLVESLVTQSGQKATVESTDTFWYGYEYEKAGPLPALASGQEPHHCGERLELDAVLGPDGKFVHLTLAVDHCRFVKWTESRAGVGNAMQISPLFARSEQTTTLVCTLGKPSFVGSLSGPAMSGIPEADTGGRVTALFVRADLALLPEGLASPGDGGFPDRSGSCQFRFYSLDRAEASRLLSGDADSDALHKAVRTLVTAGSARLERVIAGGSNYGSRAKIEEVAPYYFGSELNDRAQAAKDGKDMTLHSPRYIKLESRYLGWQIEWEPVLSEDQRLISLNFAADHSELRGMVAGHPLLESLPGQPVFAERKIVTSVNVPLGHALLVSTFNPPVNSGVNDRKDDGKTWFLFVHPAR